MLGPCRQTVRRELGLARQERQEAVSPLLAWPPGDLGHPPERLQEGLRVVSVPHLGDVDVAHRRCRSGFPTAVAGDEELLEDRPIGGLRLAQLQEHLVLRLLYLRLPFGHLREMPEYCCQR